MESRTGRLAIASNLARAILGEVDRMEVLHAIAAFAVSCCKRWGVPVATFKGWLDTYDGTTERH